MSASDDFDDPGSAFDPGDPAVAEPSPDLDLDLIDDDEDAEEDPYGAGDDDPSY